VGVRKQKCGGKDSEGIGKKGGGTEGGGGRTLDKDSHWKWVE